MGYVLYGNMTKSETSVQYSVDDDDEYGTNDKPQPNVRVAF